MVVDTTYYELLEIRPDATEIEIKRAYRRMAVRHHPDKNPDDPTANARFQAIGEAYQVLSDKGLRSRYDQFGKEQAVPDQGFEDPSEFFTSIFGGEAFLDIIGEISLIKDLTKAMEIYNEEEEGDEADKASEKTSENASVKTANDSSAKPAAGAATSGAGVTGATGTPGTPGTSGTSSVSTGTTPVASSTYTAAHARGSSNSNSNLSSKTTLQIENGPSSGTSSSSTKTTTALEKERDARKAEKLEKKAKAKKQQQELEELEKARNKAREERVAELTKKLIDRISVWTETDRNPDVTEAFKEKVRLEAENLKMESFGIEILHTVGNIYYTRGSHFLKSKKVFGFGGMFGKMKERGTMIKDTWNTISSAIEAQNVMTEMAKAEEKGGDDWTVERRAEMERTLMGKVLAAAWNGSRFEIQSVLREVCDRVLHDKTVPAAKQAQRAEALMVVGAIYRRTERTAEETNEFLLFEELVAEASSKKHKKKKRKEAEEAAAAAAASAAA